MMGLTVDSPIRFFRLTRSPRLGLGSAASLHRPETGTDSQGVSQKVSLLQNDSKEAFTTPVRVLSFCTDPSAHLERQCQQQCVHRMFVD